MIVDFGGTAVEDDRILFRLPNVCKGLKDGFRRWEWRLCFELGISSEKAGPVRGEELLKYSSEVLEDESDRTSPLEYGLFLLKCSVTSGSIVLRVRFCHPFWALKFARARRS